jgi:hypothetical protein
MIHGPYNIKLTENQLTFKQGIFVVINTFFNMEYKVY